MLREESFLSSVQEKQSACTVSKSREFIRLTNPAYLSVIELRDESERRFVERVLSHCARPIKETGGTRRLECGNPSGNAYGR